MITKEITEKEAEKRAELFEKYQAGTENMDAIMDCREIYLWAFKACADWMQKKMDKRRCDNCKNGQPSSLSEGIIFCGVLDYRFNPDFYCKYWEAKNNDK